MGEFLFVSISTVAAALLFGLWQGSWLAGVFMLAVLLATVRFYG